MGIAPALQPFTPGLPPGAASVPLLNLGLVVCQKCGSTAQAVLLQKLPRLLLWPAVSAVLHGPVPGEPHPRALRMGLVLPFLWIGEAPVLWERGREHKESSWDSQAERGLCMGGWQACSAFWVPSV